MMEGEDELPSDLHCELSNKRLVKSLAAPSTSDDDEFIGTERWAPVGESSDEQTSSSKGNSRLRELEEEQERLNNSLLSLSTHFAQVQFRLKQISKADAADRDKLLKELEDFAFKGCTDTEVVRQKSESSDIDGMERQKERQKILITRLKQQLEDLENYAYESGGGELPSNEVIARQKAVIDKLHEKVHLDLELDKMTQSDLQKKVDEALKKLVNPIKAKEKLVEQLQTQIVDLERFVNFLQMESPQRPPNSISSLPVAPRRKNSFMNFVGYHRKFERNSLKRTVEGNHYGDARARLELTVDATVELMEKYVLLSVESDPSDTDVFRGSENEMLERSEEAVVTIVRRELCSALKLLLEHGMNSSARQSSSLAPFGCYPTRGYLIKTNSARKLEHIWDVIMYYYDSKCGHEFSDAPVRRLSQSYQLEAIGGHSVTSKQMLLSTIENISSTHNRLKRSRDAMWKALVSAALNDKKLPAWIRIIFRTRKIIEECYSSWAYVARTGCEDCYDLLDRLQKYNFRLPVDLAIRPFHQMKDAF